MLSALGAPQSRGIGSNVMHVDGLAALGGGEHTVCPTTSRWASFMAWPASPAVTCASTRRCVAEHLQMTGLVFQRLGVHGNGR